jgi:hypothetical protein
MSVVTLEIFSEDALKLLQQLEVMQILKVIKSDNSQPIPQPQPRKSRFAGTISKAIFCTI